MARFNDLVRQWAKRHGLRVAETGGAITSPWRGKLASDWFHPNDVGYAMWAEAFAAVLDIPQDVTKGARAPAPSDGSRTE